MTEDRGGVPLIIGRPVQTTPYIKGMAPGDREISLYQQTLKLLAELRTIPELDKWIFPYGADSSDKDQAFVDPVATLWACFRLGKPLCILYNALKPKIPLPLQPIAIPPNATSYPNSCKKAVYDFIVACKNELGMDDSDLFTISGLYKDDTNEFVKLLNTLTIIVGKMRAAGLLSEPEPLPFTDTDNNSAPKDHNQRLLSEILNTERFYISDLEYLQKYKILLQNKNQVPKSAIIAIFSNLDNLLDFQRRFLLQMEAAVAIDSSFPKLGTLFAQNETQFSVYVIFCSNYQNATKQAAKFESSIDPVNPNIDPVRGLQSYLIKPIQRVCKYPLFLQELIKYSDPDNPSVSELKVGLSSIRRVITLVNEEKRREENFLIKLNFIERMKDWRGINVREFGDLLLSDTFVTNSLEVERPWEFFLFETILLCVKDTGKKKKNRKTNRKDSQILSGFEPYSSTPTAYVLKGQILVSKMIYVTDIYDKPSSSYVLKIFWTEGQTTNYVSLKCRNSEQSEQWKNKISYLIKRNRSKSASVETVNQRYNEPGRTCDTDVVETRRTNRHHSGSDIYMINDSDNSIDSIQNQVSRNNFVEGSDIIAGIQKDGYCTIANKFSRDNTKNIDSNTSSNSTWGFTPDKNNTKSSNLPDRIRQHSISQTQHITDPPKPPYPPDSPLSNYRNRAYSVSSNFTSSNDNNKSLQDAHTPGIGLRNYSLSKSKLSEYDKSVMRKNTFPISSTSSVQFDGKMLNDNMNHTNSEGTVSELSSQHQETPGLTNNSIDHGTNDTRSNSFSESAGMIIGTYDSSNYDLNQPFHQSPSSSNPEDSDPPDDLESFVNSQKFDPTIFNISNNSLRSSISNNHISETKDDPLYRKKNHPKLTETGIHPSNRNQRLSSVTVEYENSKLASMSSKLDGIAMSFAHVAEQELENDSRNDKSFPTDATAAMEPIHLPKSANHRTSSTKRDTIYLKVNYQLDSYIIALAPPVSYTALYERVRNKVQSSKGRPISSENASVYKSFGSKTRKSKPTPPSVPDDKSDKITIAYTLDNGTTNYVESDRDAREATDPSRKHFSGGIFVS